MGFPPARFEWEIGIWLCDGDRNPHPAADTLDLRARRVCMSVTSQLTPHPPGLTAGELYG